MPLAEAAVDLKRDCTTIHCARPKIAPIIPLKATVAHVIVAENQNRLKASSSGFYLCTLKQPITHRQIVDRINEQIIPP